MISNIQYLLKNEGFKHILGITDMAFSYSIPNCSQCIIERGSIQIRIGLFGKRHIGIDIYKNNYLVFSQDSMQVNIDQLIDILKIVEKDNYSYSILPKKDTNTGEISFPIADIEYDFYMLNHLL